LKDEFSEIGGDYVLGDDDDMAYSEELPFYQKSYF